MSLSYRASQGGPPGGPGFAGDPGYAPSSGSEPSEAGALNGEEGREGAPGSWGQRFAQQELASWRPIMRPWQYSMVLIAGGVAMLAIGVVCIQSTRGLREIRWEYSAFPVQGGLGATDRDKYNLLRSGDGLGWPVERKFTVRRDMQPPINVYYRVEGVFQNYRRYTQSKVSKQMGPVRKGEQPLQASALSQCAPQIYETGAPNSLLPNDGLVLPCGLQAWSFFNDTFQVRRVVPGQGQYEDVNMNFNNLGWEADRLLYGNKTAENFNELPPYRGGSAMTLEPWQSPRDPPNLQPLFSGDEPIGEGPEVETTLLENQPFQVWMRLGIQPAVQKLYAVIEEPLLKGQELQILGSNRFNSYQYSGRKELILTEQNFLGSAKDGSLFLGYAYCVVGILATLAGVIFQFSFCIQPRRFGDIAYLSWNRDGGR